jgi:hypothetical protein
MREHDQQSEPNPEAGHPQGETLSEESPTVGEASLRKGHVEVEGPKAGKPRGETSSGENS